MTAQQPRGRPIRADLGPLLAHSVAPGDASPEIAALFADPDLMQPLNMAPRKMDMPELRRWFASFDNRLRYLVALTEKATKRTTGFLLCDVIARHRLGQISFLNGRTGMAGRRAVMAAQCELLDELLYRRGLEKIVAQVAVENLVMRRNLERIGFTAEGTLRGQVRAFDGSRRIDQIYFGLLKEDWPGAAAMSRVPRRGRLRD